MLVVGHARQVGPTLLGRHAHDLDDLLHLVALEGHGLLIIHLGLFALKDRAQGEKFGEDTADGPHVNGGSVMFAAEQQLRCAIPYGYDNLVAAE